MSAAAVQSPREFDLQHSSRREGLSCSLTVIVRNTKEPERVRKRQDLIAKGLSNRTTPHRTALCVRLMQCMPPSPTPFRTLSVSRFHAWPSLRTPMQRSLVPRVSGAAVALRVQPASLPACPLHPRPKRVRYCPLVYARGKRPTQVVSSHCLSYPSPLPLPPSTLGLTQDEANPFLAIVSSGAQFEWPGAK